MAVSSSTLTPALAVSRLLPSVCRGPCQLISGPGGYSDVQVLTYQEKDYAVVLFEYDTCSIRAATVDLAAWLAA